MFPKAMNCEFIIPWQDKKKSGERMSGIPSNWWPELVSQWRNIINHHKRNVPWRDTSYHRLYYSLIWVKFDLFPPSSALLRLKDHTMCFACHDESIYPSNYTCNIVVLYTHKRCYSYNRVKIFARIYQNAVALQMLELNLRLGTKAPIPTDNVG